MFDENTRPARPAPVPTTQNESNTAIIEILNDSSALLLLPNNPVKETKDYSEAMVWIEIWAFVHNFEPNVIVKNPDAIILPMVAKTQGSFSVDLQKPNMDHRLLEAVEKLRFK